MLNLLFLERLPFRLAKDVGRLIFGYLKFVSPTFPHIDLIEFLHIQEFSQVLRDGQDFAHILIIVNFRVEGKLSKLCKKRLNWFIHLVE